MAADPSEYEKAIPIVAAHLAKLERAVSRTRASHTGQPFEAAHQALTEALRDEGAERVAPPGRRGTGMPDLRGDCRACRGSELSTQPRNEACTG